MIGQFDFFNSDKFRKDYRNGFYGIEACSLKSEEDVLALKAEANRYDLNIGIHFPLRSGIYPFRDPLFMDLNPETRMQSFKAIDEELEYIKQRAINPEYILFHYPKPVILSEDFDFSRWWFKDSSEYTFESQYTRENFIEHSEFLFKWLSQKSYKYNFTPVLELDAVNKYIYKESFLEELLNKYTRIRLCLDVGRLHLQDKIDQSFSAADVLMRFSKYTGIIHLWHAKVGRTVEYGHYPLLPNLKPEDGWADIETYAGIICSQNRELKLLFEHRSDLISDEELDSCYDFINKLFSDGSR